MKASGCIIAMNEEEYIERAILSLQGIDIIDEVIVVDGGSSDNTVAICERLGCKVVVKPWEQDFSLQRNFAMSLCKNDWVICLDADEYYSKNCQYALSKILPRIPDKFATIRICEITEFNHDPFNTKPFDPLDIKKYVKDFSGESLATNGCKFQTEMNLEIGVSYSYRIFNKTKGQWVNKIHEVFNVNSGYDSYVLPYEYVIHHQKSRIKQDRSDSKYFLIDNGVSAFVYNIEYNDFVDGTSQKSVSVVDDIFIKSATEISTLNHFNIDLESDIYQTLQSDIKILSTVDVIKMEVVEQSHSKTEKIDVEIKRFLAQFGFFSVLRDYKHPTQYNILFVKAPVINDDKFKALIKSYNGRATSWYFSSGIGLNSENKN